MPNYSESKIYKITSSAGLPYIGSTTHNLQIRFNQHKRNQNCESKIHFTQSDCKIELIENYSCNSKKELITQELYWINQIQCCNKNRPIITHNEYLDYQKQWYKENKEYVIEKRKEYCSIDVPCFCGRIIKKNKILNHIKSSLHKKLVFTQLPFCVIIPIRTKN
jgi:predicted GIY-YIG superfamily endonuclease